MNRLPPNANRKAMVRTVNELVDVINRLAPAPLPDDLGTSIQRARIAAGLTQAALARMVGTSGAALSLIEHNKRSPGTELYRRLERALGAYLASPAAAANRAVEKPHVSAGCLDGPPVAD